MTGTSSLYDVLGLNESASQDEIRAAYRRLAQIHHPDKGGKEEVFKSIGAAYEILGDPEKRKLYDEGKLNPQGQREPTIEEMAAQGIQQLFASYMDEEGDLLHKMRGDIQQAVQAAKDKARRARATLRKAERRLKFIVFKGKGNNLFKLAAEQVVSNCKLTVAAAEKEEALALAGLKILDDYENTDPKKDRVPGRATPSMDFATLDELFQKMGPGACRFF